MTPPPPSPYSETLRTRRVTASPGAIQHHRPHLAHPPRHLRHYQRRTPRSEDPAATGRRDAPSAAPTSHAGTPEPGAPHTSHHQDGTPFAAAHHPGPQQVSKLATGTGSPQRHAPVGRNHSGTPTHLPPLDHRTHLHLDTTSRPPPAPPHRPRGCHHHTKEGELHNGEPCLRRPHAHTRLFNTHYGRCRAHPVARHHHHLRRPQRPHTHLAT